MTTSKDDMEIFSKQKINYIPPSPITHLIACNNFLALTLKSSKLQLIPLQNPSGQNEIDVPASTSSSSKDTISSLHMDPAGDHLVFSFESGSETMYLSRKEMKLKTLPKFKGHSVSSVGWNSEICKSTSTGFTLFGTSKGVIFESEVLSTGAVSYCVELYNSPDNQTITSLKLQKLNSDPKAWLVLFTVADRIYVLNGCSSSQGQEGCLLGLFQKSQDPSSLFSIIEKGSKSTSIKQNGKLCFYPEICKSDDFSVAWLQNGGVQHGKIDINATDVAKFVNFDYYFEFSRSVLANALPVGVSMTAYHICILFEDRLSIICKINNSVVFEEIFNKTLGKPIGLASDPVSGFIWFFTEKSVIKYTPVDETKNLWSIYLEIGDHNMARKCASGNPDHLDTVLQSQCSKLMQEKKYVAAAEIYGMTNAPLEDVALKLILSENRTALKTYLQRKLDKSQEFERTQKSMLVFWLLEILLTELDEAKSGQISSSASSISTNKVEPKIQGFDHHKTKEIRDHLKMFLKNVDVIECLKSSSKAAVQLLSTHGDVEMLLYFSELIKDYESVISYYIQQERYDEALRMLQKQKNFDLYYKFSASLLPHCTSLLIDAWISMAQSLKAKLILATILEFDGDAKIVPEICRYFEYQIDALNCSDVVIHNYLVSLYAKYQPGKLIAYLEKEGKDPSMIRYDLKLALRTCLDHKLAKASIFLLCLSEMFDEAMEKALEIDSDLCISVAKASPNLEVQRRLWLKYAKNSIEKHQDVRQCVDLLQKSNGLVKIQDLLPFFDDFSVIDNFKDCLCDCLAEHSGTIKNLQLEMKEASEVAQQIKKQIDDVSNRYVIVKPRDKCSSCDQLLDESTFYAFLCHHMFHRSCLEKELEDLIDEEGREFLKECAKKVGAKKSILARSNDSTSVHSGTSNTSEIFHKREEMEKILSAECPYCGDLIIESIDKLFYPPNEYLNELKKWE